MTASRPLRGGPGLAVAGLVAIWATTRWVAPVPGFAGGDTVAGMAGLTRAPVASVIHFALADGLAPILVWIAVSPAVRAVASPDSRFAITFSGVAAATMASIQLGIGVWLTVGDPQGQVASFAGAHTLGNLEGAKAILVAIAAATIAADGVRSGSRPLPREVLLITTAGTSTAAGIGQLIGNAAVASLADAANLPFLLAVGALAWATPPRRATPPGPWPNATPVGHRRLDAPFTVPQDPLSDHLRD